METIIREQCAAGAGPRAAARPRSMDLCATCRHSPTCTLPRPADRLKLHCEEFSAVKGRGSSAPGSATGRPVNAAEERQDDWLGLCRTCENRVGCMYARAAGGVWHCEEYR